MKKIVAIVLTLLGIFMIYFGITHNMIPPSVTGVGFLAIALVFFTDSK